MSKAKQLNDWLDEYRDIFDVFLNVDHDVGKPLLARMQVLDDLLAGRPGWRCNAPGSVAAKVDDKC